MTDITRDDLFKPCAHEEDYDPHWTDDDDECPGGFSVTKRAMLEASDE